MIGFHLLFPGHTIGLADLASQHFIFQDAFGSTVGTGTFQVASMPDQLLEGHPLQAWLLACLADGGLELFLAILEVLVVLVVLFQAFEGSTDIGIFHLQLAELVDGLFAIEL